MVFFFLFVMFFLLHLDSQQGFYFMKFKDILLPVAFALLVTSFIQYVAQRFVSQQNSSESGQEVRSGQSFRAKTVEDIVKPLNTEIDFFDAPSSRKTQKVDIETDSMIVQFTNDGAAIDHLAFKRILGGKPGTLTTIYPSAYIDREKRAFIVALAEKTPYFYDVIEQKEDSDSYDVVYRGQNDHFAIIKSYRVYKKLYQIDMTVTIEPLSADEGTAAYQPRIFFPAPVMADIAQYDPIQGIVYNDRQSLVKTKPVDIGDRVWFAPTLFGAEDKYFVHSLVSDSQKFVQRAYYTLEGTMQQMRSILEGPLTSGKQSWTLSFYCGPKEAEMMGLVDKRLEATLDYGWFAGIAKLLLVLLQFFYGYIHNYGYTIIAVTVFISLLMMPLTIRGQRSADGLPDLNRKIKYLEQKYKNDRETLAREKNELLRKHGSGMFGCLPLFLQVPLFIGLNKVLTVSIDLYQAPFVGWITDLSAKDPYYVLPILTGLGIFLQTAAAAQDPRQRVTMFIFSLLIVAVTANFSAGLALFMLTNAWFRVAQTSVQKAFKI